MPGGDEDLTFNDAPRQLTVCFWLLNNTRQRQGGARKGKSLYGGDEEDTSVQKVIYWPCGFVLGIGDEMNIKTTFKETAIRRGIGGRHVACSYL